jgi:7-carboxy-7-deazaguanine synthase
MTRFSIDTVGKLRISEIFDSVQGEGQRIGTPSVFVRTSGCNLECAWCDTPQRNHTMIVIEPESLAERLRNLVPGRARDLVITGGEPVLQRASLDVMLERVAPHFTGITVETNGTIEWRSPRVSLWSISPKLGSAGYQPDNEVVSKMLEGTAGRVQLKYVIDPSTSDFDELVLHLSRLNLSASWPAPIVILQPEGSVFRTYGWKAYFEDLRKLSQQAKELADTFRVRTRVLPQLHILMEVK